MNLISFNLLIYPTFIFIFLISIIGHGKLINSSILKDQIDLNLKNLIFIKGLIFIGFICILINIFIPISDLISIFIITIGIILYLFFFIKIKNKKKETFFLIFVFLLSFFFSLYAGINDDFQYHYETIKNFKNKNIFQITHQRMISYNSHWLFLNSIFSFSKYTSSLFVLTSLFFAITIYDLINLTKSSFENNNRYLCLLSLFSLIFFLGILNKLKDFGTDIPGVIISLYIILIIFYYYFDKKILISQKIIKTISILCIFAFIVKITNGLILILLIYLFFKLKINKINYWMPLTIIIFPIPWFIQNIIISNCLIWPISITCFSNIELAIEETYLIESFAKGDIATRIDVGGLGWIKTWVYNHFNKIFETYFGFIIVLIIPLGFIFFQKKSDVKNFFNFVKNKYLNFDYKIIFFIIILCNLMWFLFAPAYRFGIFYNFLFIIMSFIPLWLFIEQKNSAVLIRYSKIILALLTIYFIFENIIKIDWYLKRYDTWPPIKNEKILERINF